MAAGQDEHDELLWRLSMQLAAQLPIEVTDKAKALEYIRLIAGMPRPALEADENNVWQIQQIARPGLKVV